MDFGWCQHCYVCRKPDFYDFEIFVVFEHLLRKQLHLEVIRSRGDLDHIKLGLIRVCPPWQIGLIWYLYIYLLLDMSRLKKKSLSSWFLGSCQNVLILTFP